MTSRAGLQGFDAVKVRADFPLISGGKAVYLDSGATTQKPASVIQAEADFYRTTNANIHRGVYRLSQDATEAYEGARAKIASFIGCKDEAEVIFTRGTTESINLVASSYAAAMLRPGDEIILSTLEHHSNIVPWQMAAQRAGAVIKVIPINDSGELLLDDYERMISSRTKLVAVTHLSNALGSVTDIRRIVNAAKQVGAKVLVDGAQWVGHFPTDVAALDCDFYVFSGHKLYGPTGIGVLWGRRELLEAMPPYQGGGDMIDRVSFEKTTYAQLPNKFEAGTPNIAGGVALGVAVDYLRSLDWSAMHIHEQAMLARATQRLASIPGVRIVGTAATKASVISFVVDGPPMGAMDVGTRLDAAGIAVRTGHHCCMPLMQRLGVAATTRISLGMYNNLADVDMAADALEKIVSGGRTPASSRLAAKIAKSTAAESASATRIAWPTATAPSVAAAADELAENFEFLGERDARNSYVLDLASKQPRLLDELKIVPDSVVTGCMSTVHLVARRAGDERIEFVADSDAEIVRGLISILQKLYSGQSAADVLAFDVEGFFRRIGLDQFITSQRRNGLAGMVKKIRQSAAVIAQGSSPANR